MTTARHGIVDLRLQCREAGQAWGTLNARVGVLDAMADAAERELLALMHGWMGCGYFPSAQFRVERRER
jgi:hypothetical protein